MNQTPPNPDEATLRQEIGRFIDLLIAVAASLGLIQVAVGLALGSLRSLIAGLVIGAFCAWVAAVPRRALRRRPPVWVVSLLAVGTLAIIPVAVTLLPFAGLVGMIGLLIPVAVALPVLDARALRRLMFLAWAGMVAALAARHLPDDPAIPAVATQIIEIVSVVTVSGLLLFLLYQSSERLKASSREFRRLFSLSSDLAETTEPAVLGQIVARHLAEALDFDDCVIYAFTPATERLAPFGSHPAGRSLELEPEPIAERPLLGRVIYDRERIIIDAANARSDPAERARLQARGRRLTLLLPLVALAKPIGVAELTASECRPVDERRIALAQTLAFEAATAIENGSALSGAAPPVTPRPAHRPRQPQPFL